MGEDEAFEEFEQRVGALQREVRSRRQVEEELRASQAWYETLADLSPVGIFRTDRNGDCLYVNRRWCEIAGLSAAEARGRGWTRAVHPDDRERVAARWYAAAAGDGVFHAEYRFRDGEGRVTWVIGDARPVLDGSGGRRGYVGTITDISDRKRMEGTLRERVKELSCLYALTRVLHDSTLSDAALLQDVVTLLPPAWQYPEIACARVSYAGHTVTTTPFRESPWRLARDITVTGEVAGRLELFYLEERPPQAAGPFLLEERQLLDEVAARLGEALELRTAERNRSCLTALAARDEQLEQFACTVSHDLKTPLTAMIGFLRLIRRSVAEGRLEKLGQFVAQGLAAGERMGERIDYLLDLARSGRLVGTREEVDLEELVGEAWATVQNSREVGDIRLEVATPLPPVRGDRRRLLEVLENLLDNAARYTGASGRARVQVGVREEGGAPIFFVADQGAGIPEDQRERVFHRFARLDDEHGSGTGAGLTIVRSIVEAHGGRIWVESEGAGRGATFCFTLAGRER